MKKRKFTFDDIIYIEHRRQSKRLYIDGEKQFKIVIHDNIDDSEFMEDVKRRKLPVNSLKLKNKLYKGKLKRKG